MMKRSFSRILLPVLVSVMASLFLCHSGRAQSLMKDPYPAKSEPLFGGWFKSDNEPKPWTGHSIMLCGGFFASSKDIETAEFRLHILSDDMRSALTRIYLENVSETEKYAAIAYYPRGLVVCVEGRKFPRLVNDRLVFDVETLSSYHGRGRSGISVTN